MPGAVTMMDSITFSTPFQLHTVERPTLILTRFAQQTLSLFDNTTRKSARHSDLFLSLVQYDSVRPLSKHVATCKT